MNLINETDSWIAISAYVCFVLSGPVSHYFRGARTHKLKKISDCYLGLLAIYLICVSIYGVYFAFKALTVTSVLLSIVLYHWPVALIVRSDYDLFKIFFDRKKHL